ncbi:MAG TPA: DUF2868 domain-containing protein [Planctomycetota bacterium]|nr:DUF2868 domain-containing protein [Planctomycetota bacterium]
MDLARLVDFEVQLHRDEETARAGGESTLQARDARLGSEIADELGLDPRGARARLRAERALRARVAEAWLLRVRGQEPGEGERTARALRLAGILLVVVALLAGAGAARAALAYDGREPVNVLVFLGVLVVPQIALFVLMLWAMLRGRQGLLGAALTALANARFLRRGAAATLGAIGARLRMHAQVERWTTIRLAQRAAVAFNVGALATCLALVAFTDLAFCWSTTLQLAPERVHAGCRAIAAPWAALFPEAVPPLELVRDSQWVRLPGRFVSGTSLPEAVARSGGWWSFLVAALVVWGLLPRVVLWAFAAWRVRAALRAVPFDDRRCNALFDRLLPDAGWAGPSPDEIGLPPHERAAGRAADAPPVSVGRGSTWLLTWGRLAKHQTELAECVRAATGAPPSGVLAVGGADLALDRAAVETLRKAGAQRALLVLAAGSQPTKDVLDLLRALRQALGPRADLGVALVHDDPRTPVANDELAGWRASLDRMVDPYLGLQRLEVPA